MTSIVGATDADTTSSFFETNCRCTRNRTEFSDQTERRRRQGGTQQAKLAISQSIKDAHPNMEFRWARDDEGRMEQLTQNDDWDLVPNVKPIHAGINKAKQAINHHLVMKPTKFMEQDNAEKMARIDDMEKAALAKPDSKSAIAEGSDTYAVPGNKI